MDSRRTGSTFVQRLAYIPDIIALLANVHILVSDDDLLDHFGPATTTINQWTCTVWDTLRNIKTELMTIQRQNVRTAEPERNDEQNIQRIISGVQRVQVLFSQLTTNADNIWKKYYTIFEDLDEVWCESDVRTKELELERCVLLQESRLMLERLTKCPLETNRFFLSTSFTGLMLWGDFELILRYLVELVGLDDILCVMPVTYDENFLTSEKLTILDKRIRSNSVFKKSLLDILHCGTTIKETETDKDIRDAFNEVSSENTRFPRSEGHGEVLKWCSRGFTICGNILKGIRDEEFLPYKSEQIIARIIEIKTTVRDCIINLENFIKKQLQMLSRKTVCGLNGHVFTIMKEEASEVLLRGANLLIGDNHTITVMENIYRGIKNNMVGQLKTKFELAKQRQEHLRLRETRERMQKILVLVEKATILFKEIEVSVEALPVMELPPPLPKKTSKVTERGYRIGYGFIETHIKPTHDICVVVTEVLDEQILGRLLFSWMRMWMFPDVEALELSELSGGRHDFSCSKEKTKPVVLEKFELECMAVHTAIVHVIDREFTQTRSAQSPCIMPHRFSRMNIQRNTGRCRLVFDSDYDMLRSNRKVVRNSVDLK